jgi:dihydrofolate reductase
MKIIAVAAISKNGFLTNGTDPDPTSWTSNEDKEFFKNIRNQHKLFVMGSSTYEAAQPSPSDGIFRVVLTHTPDRYADKMVAGQLEFHNLAPEKFVEKFQNSYESCLVLGGGKVYQEFLEAGLVDELYLTIEPIEFSSGVAFLQNNKTLEDYGLLLNDPETLNTFGTVLRSYRRARTK